MKTKIVIALITVVAFGVLATGIVLAHNSSPATTYPRDSYGPDAGYYGWGPRCYGYDQEYYRYPPSTQDPDTTGPPQPPVPTQPTIPGDPNYYPRGYGRGCWGW